MSQIHWYVQWFLSFHLVMKKVMIIKNSVVKMQTLIMNHKSQPVKLNPSYGFLLVLWFDITHTNTHTHTHTHTHTYTKTQTKAHMTTGVNRLTHPYKYISTPPVMCSQQLSVIHWYRKCIFFSKITHLQKQYIYWLVAIRLSSSCET